MVCQDPVAVPTAQSKMKNVYQSNPMCALGKVQYKCNAGGINIFKVAQSKDLLKSFAPYHGPVDTP